MARFTTLYSGSSGNSALVEENGRYLLVDMGKSCRMTQNALKGLGLPLADLGGILVTHEHSDHVSGLAIFLKYHPVPVYGSAATLDYLACRGLVPPGAELIDIDGRTEDVCGFAVQSFETSHDSVACRGYRITTPLGRVAGVATDLGYVSDEVLANLLLADVVALEANYDYNMLMTGPYPYYLKTRPSAGICAMRRTRPRWCVCWKTDVKGSRCAISARRTIPRSLRWKACAPRCWARALCRGGTAL